MQTLYKIQYATCNGSSITPSCMIWIKLKMGMFKECNNIYIQHI